MLRQLQALRLIVRADALAVERGRPLQHLLVDEASDDLPVLEDEGHLARAHFEHGARAAPAGAGIAEARIEEAGIVDAELPHGGIDRRHLGGEGRRDVDPLLRGEDVELVGIEDEAFVPARVHGFPELAHVVAGAALHIDQAGVTLGAIADEAVEAEEIDAHGDAFAHIGIVVVDQALTPVQRAQCVGVEQAVGVAETDLREARALAHQHRERARADLGVQRAVVAELDAVEAARLVRDHAGEYIEPAGGTLRIGGSGDGVRQRQALLQRHDVDAAGLEHGAVAERDLVQLELVDALGHGGARPRQEARAHTKGDLPQPQVEARGLDLVGHELGRGEDRPGAGKLRDHVIGQDAFLVDGEGERHAVLLVP